MGSPFSSPSLTPPAQVPTNAAAVGAAHLLPPLTKLLQTKNQFILTETTHALSLVLRHVANQDTFYADGGLPFLLALQGDENPGLQLRVLETLKFLVLNPKLRAEILSTNVLRRFANMLNSRAPLLQAVAVKAVAEFVKDDLLVHQLADEPQIVPGLLNTLGSKEEKVKERALAALSSFIDNPTNADLFVQLKGVQFALVLTRSKKPQIQHQALLVLATALQHCPNGRRDVFATGALPVLVEFLKDEEPKVRKPALFVLSMVSQDPNTLTAFCNAGAVGSFVELASEQQDEATRVRALQALANISAEKSSLKVFASEGSELFQMFAKTLPDGNLGASFHDNALRVLANSAASEACVELMLASKLIPLIVARLSDNNKLLRSVALKAVLLLARAGQAGVKAELKRADAAHKLQELVNVPDENVKVAAAKAIEFLA